MKTVSRALIIFSALLIISLAIWFIFFLQPDVAPDAAREKELLDSADTRDVIIIFNSGGWGNAPLKAASDFTPILTGIQDSLAERGYSSLITPFTRTPRGLTGDIEDTKDLLDSFKYSSEALAGEVEFIMSNFPDKQVIIAGLSNGGGLTERAMQRLADRSGIYAIVAGVPRWYQIYTSDNVLNLDNDGKDKIAVGDYRAIALAVMKAPFRWLRAKINHQGLSFALAIEIPGHDYPWSSGEVGPPVVNFINAHFKVKRTQ